MFIWWSVIIDFGFLLCICTCRHWIHCYEHLAILSQDSLSSSPPPLFDLINSFKYNISVIPISDHNKSILQINATKNCGYPEHGNPAHQQVSNLQPLSSIPVPEEVHPNQNKDGSTSLCVTEEWAQLLIVDEIDDGYSLASISSPNFRIPHQLRAGLWTIRRPKFWGDWKPQNS